jgi:hypothetical protein
MTGGFFPDMFFLRVHLTVIPAMCDEGTVLVKMFFRDPPPAS